MVKIELPVAPDGFVADGYPGQFATMTWLMTAMGAPAALFMVTTRKRSGLANVQPNYWGMLLGSGAEPRFLLMVHNYTDTLRLIRENGEFVINYASAELSDRILRTAGTYDEDTDEVLASGLTPVASTVVKAPRIAEAFGHFECTLEWVRDVESDCKKNTLVMGRIVAAAMAEDRVRGSRADIVRQRAIPYWVGAHYDGDNRQVVVAGSRTLTLDPTPLTAESGKGD